MEQMSQVFILHTCRRSITRTSGTPGWCERRAERWRRSWTSCPAGVKTQLTSSCRSIAFRTLYRRWGLSEAPYMVPSWPVWLLQNFSGWRRRKSLQSIFKYVLSSCRSFESTWKIFEVATKLLSRYKPAMIYLWMIHIFRRINSNYDFKTIYQEH